MMSVIQCMEEKWKVVYTSYFSELVYSRVRFSESAHLQVIFHSFLLFFFCQIILHLVNFYVYLDVLQTWYKTSHSTIVHMHVTDMV